MNKQKTLEYRRQFLLSSLECKSNFWNLVKINNQFLYIHPDCDYENSEVNNKVHLIGYFIDPHNKSLNSKEILNIIASKKEINDSIKELHRLVGRFIIIIEHNDDLIFLNDACGLKTLYYTKNKYGFFAASQPLLINLATKIYKNRENHVYFSSQYFNSNKEHWLPCGITLYSDVHQLTPNHYFSKNEFQQFRYYPYKKLIKAGDYEKKVIKFSNLLKNFKSANYKMNLSFSLTAGWDSRIILSCCKGDY